MIIQESPIVEDFRRNLTFPDVIWLGKNEFNNKLLDASACGIFPCVVNPVSNEKLYIAKNIPYLTNTSKNVFIGYVSANDTNVIKIATGEKRVLQNDDYYILTINDPDSCCWRETCGDSIPKYALRACLNYDIFEYFYVGRSVNTGLIGNVCRSDGMLYACNELNEAKTFQNFEILCLKPSTASLKQLCRTAIRLLTGHNNSSMTVGLQNLLPNSLVDYIKYPSGLLDGDCLLKNEKLVSSNGLHKLHLTQNSKLVYETEEEKSRVLYDFVESIWVHRYFTVINRFDNAFVYFLYLLNPNERNSSGTPPRLQITDNGQLVLQQGDVTFKKYFIQCNNEKNIIF